MDALISKLGLQRTEPKVLQVLLTHADRCWKAEETNATRLAAKSNLVLSAISATLALTVFLVNRSILVADNLPSIPRALVWLLLLCAAGSLFVALMKSLGIVGHRSSGGGFPFASSTLPIPQALEMPSAPTEDEVLALAFIRVYRAADNLHLRNAQRNRSIGDAQAYLFAGMVWLIVWTLSYNLLPMFFSARSGASAMPPETAPLHPVPAAASAGAQTGASSPRRPGLDIETLLRELSQQVRENQEAVRRIQARRPALGLHTTV
ncbi:hypothetical protein BH11PLA1_BH11PLA1_22160 [soil metagenome]